MMPWCHHLIYKYILDRIISIQWVCCATYWGHIFIVGSLKFGIKILIFVVMFEIQMVFQINTSVILVLLLVNKVLLLN